MLTIFKLNVTDIDHSGYLCDPKRVDKTKLTKNISVSYLEGNIPAVDLAVLCSCDHMLSAVGTFSWWSAWLTGGNVTYYKWPTKEGTPIRQHFSKNYTNNCGNLNLCYRKYSFIIIRYPRIRNVAK